MDCSSLEKTDKEFREKSRKEHPFFKAAEPLRQSFEKLQERLKSGHVQKTQEPEEKEKTPTTSQRKGKAARKRAKKQKKKKRK
jgi:hypothetical protein